MPGCRRYAVTFIDDDTRPAVGGRGAIEILDLATGASVDDATVNGDAVEMAWSPTTHHLAVGTSTGELSVFYLPPTEIFSDGFESGDSSAWSSIVS